MSSTLSDTTAAELLLISNDPPGIRCNHNLVAALEIANVYRVAIRLLPRSLAGAEAVAPAIYLDGEPLAVDGDARKGVADQELLAAALERAGVPRQQKPGRLAAIEPALGRLREAIGAVPN